MSVRSGAGTSPLKELMDTFPSTAINAQVELLSKFKMISLDLL